MAEEKEINSSNEGEFSAPTETIDNCLQIIATVYNAKADSIVSADEIYAITGKPRGTMSPKISACTQYGFLINHHKKGYQITDFGVSIIRPEFDELIRKKQLEAFSTPPLYKKLIERYNSKGMPTQKGLTNILVSEFDLNANSTGPKAAYIFLENCRNLNIVENDRMRFFMPNVNVTETPKEENKTTSAAIENDNQMIVKQKGPEYIDFPIDLGANKTAHFIYPKTVSPDELQIIKIMLEAKLKTLITISKIQDVDANKISFETEIQDSDSIKKAP
jgi:hypothetical protein